jgi:hypothetical protein
VVLCPVLRRPHRVQPLAASLEASCPDGAARLVFIATEGDDAEIDAVRATGCDLLILPGPHQPGDFSRKINWGYRHTTEPLMLLCGDDVTFHPGWLEAAAGLVCGPVQVVGTNDLSNPRVLKGLHSTHPVVARRYADEQGTIDGPGAVLTELYQHNYCDDELIGTAKKRKAWGFARDSIVEHFHPYHHKAQDDEVYRIGRSGMAADRALFRQREHLWRL